MTIDLRNDCFPIKTVGVGGARKVYLLKQPILVKIGESERRIPLGFLVRNKNDQHEIPPLLGRYQSLDSFAVTFKNFLTTLED